MTLFERIRRVFPAAPSTPSERLPNFFIAGAARSGTTSMWQYLRQHPEIYMPEAIDYKEPSFYGTLYGMRDRQAYLALFKDAGRKKLVGEASGPYLTDPSSPALIHKEIPHARFIVMLRNPADRAFSLFKWMQENGYEKTATFDEALKVETESRFNNDSFIQNNGQYYYNFLYFHSGLYAAQVKRLFDTFGRDRVFPIIHEEFARETACWVRATYSFLGVNPSFKPHLEVHNATSRDRHSFDPGLRAELIQRYAPDVRKLEQLLNRDLVSLWS
jgi:hypothetical protein